MVFKRLKYLISTAPIHNYFDASKSTIRSSDSWQNAEGAVLLQDNKPFAYVSQIFTKSQHNFGQIEKELYSILFSMY